MARFILLDILTENINEQEVKKSQPTVEMF